jgi:hypothetical protein
MTGSGSPRARTASASGQASGAPTATAPGASGDPDTTVTFTVTSGLLTMTAPATADLGSGVPGATITGTIGNTTVTDDRAQLAASWTATASSTSWTTGGGAPAETIPATDATYSPGALTTTGIITDRPFDITLSSGPQTVVTGTGGTGDNSATWDPTLHVSVPAAAVIGTYTATLTQAVS